MQKQIIYLLISFAIICSCSKYIDIDQELLDPQIVINSIITPDSLIKVNLYQNISINENEVKRLNNATIKLFEDTYETETLKKSYDLIKKSDTIIQDTDGLSYIKTNYDTTFYFTSDATLAKAGKTYQLKVSCEGYNDAICETTIPNHVEIIKVDTSTAYINQTDYKKAEINFKMQFNDPPSEKNYYRLILEQTRGNRKGIVTDKGDTLYYIDVYKYDRYFISSSDPILNKEEKDPDSYIIGEPWSSYDLFTDERINGKIYSFSFSYSDDFNYSEKNMIDDLIIDFKNGEFVNYTIYLQNLNYETYLYYTSFDAQFYFNNIPVVEPVPVYTNVENGLGFFGSYATSSKNITVGEYPKEGVFYGKLELMDKYGPEIYSYPDLK